ncbi:MAG: tripartite tricarboxylate transporter substrate binding protein [Alphaproteobacteria bacterium]|jgi:tripartite-type tricarboxylate transporter receptor subunit TctC|nr:MAG: tripartite tricarboxylate transporter substrate binding protein [Alphaproteobacteria bacterium]
MRMLSRRCLLLGALIAPWAAHAQNWPAGNIKIVVPYPPGGSTDMIARLIQPHMQQRLGTTVIVENRAGGGGSVGTAAVAKSSPDGSSWVMVFDNHAANPFVFPNLPFNTETDLDPVQLIGTAPYVLSTNPQKPFKTLADVVTAAKAKPGTLSYATVGAGSIGHLAMELLWKQAGVQLVHVPYRGGAPAMNDLIAGHVDLFIASTAASIPFIQAGSIRALTQSGKTRTSTLANVPAIAESYPGFEAYAWWGVFAPAGTPKAIVNKFADELAASLRDPRVAKQLNETQQVTFALGGPEELRKFVSDQMRLWGPVAREHNIQAD